MTRGRDAILAELADAVVNMDEELAVAAAQEALDAGLDAFEAINGGLARGMAVVSDKYDSGEYFVPEILVCSDAMYAGIEVLKPHLKPESVGTPMKAVIGVVEGDIHDLGKNIVKIMMDAAGFEMHDLGRDVPLAQFVERAQEVGAQFICLSTLMTTTMPGMPKVIEMLRERGIRDRHLVLVGGGPISPSYADSIGADGYAEDAARAVKLAQRLAGERAWAQIA